jgi:glycosyltransferase involved in cell wall biosynthesis
MLSSYISASIQCNQITNRVCRRGLAVQFLGINPCTIIWTLSDRGYFRRTMYLRRFTLALIWKGLESYIFVLYCSLWLQASCMKLVLSEWYHFWFFTDAMTHCQWAFLESLFLGQSDSREGSKCAARMLTSFASNTFPCWWILMTHFHNK